MKNSNALGFIGGLVMLVLTLYIASQILSGVGNDIGTFNETTNPFDGALNFVGLSGHGGTGNSWTANSIIGILGFAAIGLFIITYFKLKFW